MNHFRLDRPRVSSTDLVYHSSAPLGASIIERSEHTNSVPLSRLSFISSLALKCRVVL